MVNLSTEIRDYTSKTDQEAEGVLKQALKWHTEKYPLGKTAKPEGKFKPVNPRDIEDINVLEHMAIYTAWVTYYTYQATKWKTLHEYLEGLYDTLCKTYIVQSTKESSDRKRECTAKVIYSPIERARQIAKQKMLEAIGKQENATLQYQLLSRVITFQGDERRMTR